MDLTRLKALIDLVSESKVSELEITEDGVRVRISKGGPAPTSSPAPSDSAARPSQRPVTDRPPVPERAAAPPAGHVVASPMFGIFHRAPSPDAPPFVEIGSRIGSGDQLCLIEAMKSFNLVSADAAGEVTAILAENGQEVEPGQALFRIGR